MSGDKKPPIIKKIIKKGHGGHHGGSWKVAYADFVTAMMAFFLVMWLLAVSSQQGKAALAEYFENLTVQDAVFNGGLPMAFTAAGAKGPGIMEGGCFKPMTEGEQTQEVPDEMAQQAAQLVQAIKDALENMESLPEGVEGGEGAGDEGRAAVSEVESAKQQFADELTSDMQNKLGSDMAAQVTVEKVPGGLRIQIVDKEGRPMFQLGGPQLTAEAKAILGVVAERLLSIDNKISIEGHTDALRTAGQRITNWELSTARASAARVFLSQSGLDEERLTMVAGYAATQPLDKANPFDPINRRISIMVWDNEPGPGDGPQSELQPAPADSMPQDNEPWEAAPAGGAGTSGAEAGSFGNSEESVAGSRNASAPAPPPLTPENLERQLVEETLNKAAVPDMSTVGPAVRSPSDDTRR